MPRLRTERPVDLERHAIVQEAEDEAAALPWIARENDRSGVPVLHGIRRGLVQD